MIECIIGRCTPAPNWILLLIKDGKRIGIECKRVDAPRLTASMRTAFDTLELSKLAVIYPGQIAYPLAENIIALPLTSLVQNPASILG